LVSQLRKPPAPCGDAGRLCVHSFLQPRAKYYIDKGRNLDNGHNYAEAALTYRKAIQIDPENGEAYYQLGLADFT